MTEIEEAKKQERERILALLMKEYPAITTTLRLKKMIEEDDRGSQEIGGVESMP